MRTNLLHFATAFALSSATVLAADWRPVDPSELAQKTPRVEPNADAEAIFWDVKVEDSVDGGDLKLTLNHYIRIKLFTDRAIEKYATVEIPRAGKRDIREVAGRTIKPDGTIIDLKKDGIFERELVKTKGLKLRGTTFTLPNVAAGDIIEYRYKEVRNGEIASHMRLYYQRELPMWNVTYHLKPLNIPWLPYQMRSMAFQCKLPPFQKEPQGFYAVSLTNVPAFREEPNMPPEDELRAWVLIYYEEDKKVDPEKFWKETGRTDFNSFKPRMNADGAVKRTAAEVVSGAGTPQEKLAALDAFCRTRIRNMSGGPYHMTSEERKAVKENHSPGDTLKQKAGWGIDIDLLFASLVNAAGFEARMCRIANRGDAFFNKARPTTYFLDNFSVAVKVNDTWTFFDPGTPYLEHGMLRWQEEGVSALISDPKEGFFVDTQFSEPTRSVRKRRANLKLLEDGGLEGTVEYTYTGHAAVSQKGFYEDLTPAQQEEDWKKSLQERLSTAEISGFEMKNAGEAEKPLVVTHKLNVPGYATRTGKRILLQPAFFQHNARPRFTETERKWSVYFDYGWLEDDEVTIELPDGWELDQPNAPQSGNISDVGAYEVHVRKTVDGRKLIYQRKFDWGRGNRLLFPAEAYLPLKKAFEFIQDQDNYTVSLKAAADAK